MITTKQRALMTNANLARPTIHRQLLLVLSTLIFAVSGAAQHRISCFKIGTNLLQTLHLHGNVLKPSAVHQLGHIQRRATVRALSPALGQPAGNTRVTAELRAVRTEVRFAELLHTDEAAKHIAKGLE